MRYFLIVLAVALVGCPETPKQPDDPYVCRVAPGAYSRCVTYVDGSCSEVRYTQWRSLAPSSADTMVWTQECDTEEYELSEPSQLGGEITSSVIFDFQDDYLLEDWFVMLTFEGKECFERYVVRYVRPWEECQ